MKKRGSAIIIAMLLIAAVGGIAFGVSRLLYIESASAGVFVNGAVAYYSAESAMEEGFLRYRYDKNSEVPFSSWVLADNKVYRTNLSDNALVSTSGSAGTSPSSAISDTTKQYYDLRMGYLGTYGEPNYGQDANKSDASEATTPISTYDIFSSNYGTGDYDFLHVWKDDVVTFDLTNINFQTEKLFVQLLTKNAGYGGWTALDECRAASEIKFVVKNSVGNVSEYKALTSYNPAACASSLNTNKNNMIAADPVFATGGYTNAISHSPSAQQVDYYYKISDIFTRMLTQAGKSVESNYQEVQMSVRPLYHGYGTMVSIGTDKCNQAANRATCLSDRTAVVPGPFTTISTTGYFGGTTRKLEANIDRQSGTLYDLFDYVIYKNT